MSTGLVSKGLLNGAIVTTDRRVERRRRVRCKLCREEREIEVDTWDDRVEPEFAHPCKEKGPKLSHPVTRSGEPLPFFPVGDRLAVERLPEQTKIGQIDIPETSQAKQQYATVIAAGPQAQGVLDDMGISIGDTVTFAKYSGIEWEWIPTGKGIADKQKVDLINVKDIQGGAELASKMIDGRLGIMLHKLDDGRQEYRFFEEIGKKESV